MATVDTSTETSNNKHTCIPVSTTEVSTTVKDASEPKINGGDTDQKEQESVSNSTTTTTDKKTENETTTSKPDDNQNKNETQTQTQTEEELLSAGSKLITEEKYSEAAEILSNAMEIIQQKDIANTIESVKYYMAYGEALLRLVQSSNDLFGAPVRESQQQHLADKDEEEDDDDFPEPMLITDATEKTEEAKDEKKENTNTGNSKEEQDDDEDDDVDLKQNENASNSKEEAEDEPEPAAAPDGDVDTADDREYAWESFEYARGIIEEYLAKQENKDKDNDEYYKLLALAHSFLGELLIEDEVNDAALTEFNKAIEIQNKIKNKDVIKCREKASNHFMACLAAQFAEKDEEAVKHCDAALKGLSERISELLTQFGCTESMEMKDNDYTQIIKLAEDFMGDNTKFDDAKKMSEDGKEMKDLVDIMGDLCAKLEEVKEVIQLKKDGKYGNNTAGQSEAIGAASAMGAFDQQLAMDPLQALISGLTSKFGIDEEQLAAMAAEEEQGDDENKNTSNKNVSTTQPAPAGVTTIGFGNVEPVKDGEEVNEIMCVKRKNKDDTKKETEKVMDDNVSVEKEKKKLSGRKRKMEDADIDDGMEEVNGAAKKMKLNSGDAAVAENEDRK